MKNRQKLKKVNSRKEYKVIDFDLHAWDGIDCCTCWNEFRGCKRGNVTCHPEKGRNRNWKEFRKTQWK